MGELTKGGSAMSGLTKGDIVTVFGATGFVGRHVVRALANEGYRVRAAVRRPDLAGHLQPMGTPGQIMPVQANLRYPKSIDAALSGADAAINLVGILSQSGSQSFDAIHVEGPAKIAEYASKHGLKSLIHLSAIGADEKSKSRYGRSKAQGEQQVLSGFPNAVILRPSIIFGPEDEFFNRFAEMATKSPIIPLIGGGNTRMQPVYVGDVAGAVCAALGGNAAPGAIYELGGSEIFTFKELLEKTLEYSGRDRALFYIPFWLMKIQAFFMKILPNPPITNDQVRMLQTDNIVSRAAIEEGRTLAGLGISRPHSVALEVPTYLERFNPKGQYANYHS